MNKKINIVAPLLALSFLTSCNKGNDYEVTEKEFTKIIAMENVDFLQVKENNTTSGDSTYTREMSPKTYHVVEDSAIFLETYVFKREETDKTIYKKITRDDPKGSFTPEIDVGEGEFDTAHSYGDNLLQNYNSWIESGGTLSLDKKNKCYQLSCSIEGLGTFQSNYYFHKKKLIKVIKKIIESSNAQTSTIDFTYNKVTPTPPAF